MPVYTGIPEVTVNDKPLYLIIAMLYLIQIAMHTEHKYFITKTSTILACYFAWQCIFTVH